jgi:hypothetical protein
LNSLDSERDSFVYEVMSFWLKRIPKLVHDYSLVGFILAPQPVIMREASLQLTESTIYTDAVSRLIGKLFVDINTSSQLQVPRSERIAHQTTAFIKEHRDFCNQTGTFAHDFMWNEPDKEERIVLCQCHLTWTVNRSIILGKLACLVLSKILGIGTAERNWKQVKKLKSGDRSNLSMAVTSKITNVYGQYQQMKARSRQQHMSSVGKLWTEEDFHTMKMDLYCGDIADSLDRDNRMATMRIFRNWNERWHHPAHGLSARGDELLEERLKNNFLGIKLIYDEKMVWIQNVVLRKKRGDNKMLIANNEKFE